MAETQYRVAGTSAPVLPQPQTGALQAPPDIGGGQETPGADALAGVIPPIGQTIAQNTIAAGQQNNGSPRDWAENAVAGVTAALAGFGAGGKAPPGAGAAYGIGAAARQMQANRQQQAQLKTENAQKQQQLDLEKQRANSEQSNQDRDYNLRVQESARQQATQTKAFAMDDAQLKFPAIARRERGASRQ